VVVADRRNFVGRSPDPDRQKNHGQREWGHLQYDPGEADGPRLFGKHNTCCKESSEPTWYMTTAPQGDSHDDRRHKFAESVDRRERLTRSRIEVRDQKLRGRIVGHMCRRGSCKIEADENIDDGAAEGADPAKENGNSGSRRTTLSNQHGDCAIGDGDGPERQLGERARDIELRMVVCCDRQHFERDRRCLDDLVGSLWIDPSAPM
jgi:hypothetical protein